MQHSQHSAVVLDSVVLFRCRKPGIWFGTWAPTLWDTVVGSYTAQVSQVYDLLAVRGT